MSEGKGLSDRPLPAKALVRLAWLRLADGTWPMRLDETKGDPTTTYWASLACRTHTDFGGPKFDLEPTLAAMAKWRLASLAPASAEANLRWLARHEQQTDARLAELIDLLGERPPQWRTGVDAARMEYLDWHMGTFAMFQAGALAWHQWCPALQAALVAHQRTDGAHAGSWDPVDANGQLGGRVWSTALNTLSLEVSERCANMVVRGGAKKK